MISRHTEAYTTIFGYKVGPKEKDDYPQQLTALSYAPIANTIFLTKVLSKIRKDAKLQQRSLKNPGYRAILARTILCSTIVLIPVVMLLDLIGTIINCGLKCKKSTGNVGSRKWHVQRGAKQNASGQYVSES